MNLRLVSKRFVGIVVLVCVALCAHAAEPAKKSVQAPHGQTISVEMIGPVTQTTDLQIICILKHDAAGDKYIEAMDDFNQKLGRFLSNLRERGESAHHRDRGVGRRGELLVRAGAPARAHEEEVGERAADVDPELEAHAVRPASPR